MNLNSTLQLEPLPLASREILFWAGLALWRCPGESRNQCHSVSGIGYIAVLIALCVWAILVSYAK
jgi:hypothetical protein